MTTGTLDYRVLERQAQTVRVEIHHDESCQDLYDVCGGSFTFVTGNSRHSHYTPNWNADDYPNARWFPLHVFEHGRVLYTLQSDPRVPGTDCQWDGVSGGAMIGLHDDVDWGESPEDVVRDIAQSITDWSNGDIFGYVVETTDGKDYDSCWGFLGWDSVVEAAKEAVNGRPIVETNDLAEGAF